MLNTGQQLIIAVGLVAMLWRATQGVVDGKMTLGDLVMVNAFMIQLYIPLNFLGVIYREIKQSLTDLEKMFTLMEREREIADVPGAQALRLDGETPVAFENVSFSYDVGSAANPGDGRTILHNISFEIPQARRWLWWAPPALASPRWRVCCFVFTT
jgi:ATP-binding cassette subfamily B protein